MIFNDSDFNKHWPTKTLNELGIFKRGKSKHRPRNDKRLFDGGNIPLIQTGEVKQANIFIQSHSANYNSFGLAQSKIWPKGTLCITIAANIAETSILDYEMCFPDSIVGFNAFQEKCSEVFMHYIFTYIRSSIQTRIQGSIQDNINIEYLTGLKFKIPENQERQRIESLLFALDAKIEVNNKINQELEAMAKLVYDYWFVQFDFPMPKDYAASICKPKLAGKPYKTSGGKMVYNNELKREIPKGWEDGVIADLIKNDKSGDWGKDEVQGNYTVGVSCIRGADINGINGQGEVKAPKRFILEKNTHKILEPFDLVVEISGGSPTQSTGRLTYITEATQERFDNPLICSNFCKALTLKEPKSLFNFVFEWNRLYEAGVLFGWEGKTSGIKNLLFENFVTNHKIPLIPTELMNQFFDKVYPIHQKIQKNLLENQKLAELRDWLLPMLMNGQVRVAHSLEKGNLKEAYDEVEDVVSGPDSYREAAEDGIKYGDG